MLTKHALIVGALAASALVLGGCAAEPGAGAPRPAPPAPSSAATGPAAAEPDVAEPTTPAPAAVTQDETCDWGSGRLASGSADAVPSAPGGDLTTALIGAWQHTHIDTGSGYEAVSPTTDIRYVFPSTARLLYCQDVENATSQAENTADITLDGTELVLPSPATGYAVTAWDADTMVWTNHRDGSTYLLKRR